MECLPKTMSCAKSEDHRLGYHTHVITYANILERVQAMGDTHLYIKSYIHKALNRLMGTNCTYILHIT